MHSQAFVLSVWMFTGLPMPSTFYKLAFRAGTQRQRQVVPSPGSPKLILFLEPVSTPGPVLLRPHVELSGSCRAHAWPCFCCVGSNSPARE